MERERNTQTKLEPGTVRVGTLLTEDGRVVAKDLYIADTFSSRLRGLMFRPSMPETEALCIEPCSSIHCCFMKFPIDVLFISQDWVVVHTIERMKPWTFSKIIRGAYRVVECHEGTIEKVGIKPGMTLLIASG